MSRSEITVTMLGATNSGKTTFMLGMYAILSGGFEGYFLHTRDRDLDVELSETWDALCDEGILPKPNDEQAFRSYPMVFREGFAPLVDIDWFDYRGGAMREKAGAADVAALHQRLNESDSVYLVLDGELLADTTQSEDEIRRRSWTPRMTKALQESVEQRKKVGLGPPSMVILVTKADLLDLPGPENPQRVEELEPLLRVLLPVCFLPGTVTMVCPVTLGPLGIPDRDAPRARIAPETVRPKRLQLPMIFSLYCHSLLAAATAGQQITSTKAVRTQQEQQLARLVSASLPILRRGAIRRTTSTLASTAATEERLEEQRGLLTKTAEAMMDSLKDTPLFNDGERV